MRTNDAGGRGSVVLTQDLDDSVIELAVRGQWTNQTKIDVHHALRKSLAEQPAALIVDLNEMNDLDGSSAPIWIAASQAVLALRPPAQLALCAPPTRRIVTRLRQLGCTRFLSLFVTVDQARAAVAAAPPLTDRLQLRWLPPDAESLIAVRDAVDLACRVWNLPALADTARDVALDLAGDSIAHAGTVMRFVLSRRSNSLYLALCDHEPTLPPMRPPAARLPVVISRSFVFGASATYDGKVVWAVVR